MSHSATAGTFIGRVGDRLEIQRALLVRTAMARYGHGSFGFFWVIVEPMMFSLGVSIIWTFAGLTHGAVSTVAFALTGYTLLQYFRHITAHFVKIVAHHSDVLYHANVGVFDILLSRAMLEGLGCLASFFVAYIPISMIGWLDPMRDPLVSLGGFLYGAWFSLGFGLILAGLSELNETLERIISPLMYLTLPLTGAFTMQAWMPPSARAILAYSPLVNAMEMFRAGMLNGEIPTYYDVGYLIAFCSVQMAIGIVLLRYALRMVQVH